MRCKEKVLLSACLHVSLLRARRRNVPEGSLAALRVMNPNGPSALTAPGPQEVGGEHVEGHQDLILAMQGSGTVNGISPPGREGLVLQASEGNQGLAASGLARRTVVPRQDSPLHNGFESIWVN